MLIHLRPALLLTLLFTVLTGIAYPLAITGVAKLLFPAAATGSLIESDGAIIGCG
jgi:potassium-transporting ATPase KdpC subunit